jgi:hypothetical protein
MNEKIKDLIDRCEDYGTWDNKTHTFDKEKFAKLILAEALRIITPREGDAVIQYQWLNFYQKRDRINEHFGTEYGKVEDTH